MASSRIKTLVLLARATDKLSYYDDWADAFLSDDRLDAAALDILDKSSMDAAKKTINSYDLIVLHHSTNGCGINQIAPYKDILAGRKCRLLVLVGNEVNLPHISMSEKIGFLRDIEADFIGTQLMEDASRWFYSACPSSKTIPMPPALNPRAFKRIIPQEKREIDIGVRSTMYIPHLGDNERKDIFTFFLNNRFDPPLKVDISTKTRFNRERWASFLNRCKGTISNEAGTYYLEKDDTTVRAIQRYVEDKASRTGVRVVSDNSKAPRLWHILPGEAKVFMKKALKPFGVIARKESFSLVDFSEIFDIFYKDYKKLPFHTKCISSRHFDAIGTHTCQIMFEGRFNDILKPDEHYIALNRNFSNIDDCMKRFNDVSYRKSMAQCAYDHVIASHTYYNRITTLIDHIS
jgi:hypothetical protein